MTNKPKVGEEGWFFRDDLGVVFPCKILEEVDRVTCIKMFVSFPTPCRITKRAVTTVYRSELFKDVEQ
jgi:hypothetical protein